MGLVPKSQWVVIGRAKRTGKKSYTRAGGYGVVLPRCNLCYGFIRHKQYVMVAVPQNDGSLSNGAPAHLHCAYEYQLRWA